MPPPCVDRSRNSTPDARRSGISSIREAPFSDQSWREYRDWIATDTKTLARINALIEECRRTPFRGTGKPEPLRGDLSGWWSRRITREDRMVYRVSGSGAEQTLEIAQLRFHY